MLPRLLYRSALPFTSLQARFPSRRQQMHGIVITTTLFLFSLTLVANASVTTGKSGGYNSQGKRLFVSHKTVENVAVEKRQQTRESDSSCSSQYCVRATRKAGETCMLML